jgi:hypothetical protein
MGMQPGTTTRSLSHLARWAAILVSAVAACAPMSSVPSVPDGPTSSVAPAAASSASPPEFPVPGASDSAPSPVIDDIFAAMFDAIQAHRPGYRFQLTPDRLDGDWRLDGDADDGAGPGRLFVDLTETPGSMSANPCADGDFRQDGSCAVRDLPNGDLVFLRDLVEANGTLTVVVALVHPDRSGITTEASNFSMAGLSPPILLPDHPMPTVTRVGPLYTVTELAELVVAIDARIRALLGD